jgi:predicted small lipoprotein YifL
VPAGLHSGGTKSAIVPSDRGISVTRRAVPWFRPAPLVALAALLLLAGCGLKGPLEPPPAAAPEAQLNGEPGQPQPPAERDPNVDPRRQPLRKNLPFLDWLLD